MSYYDNINFEHLLAVWEEFKRGKQKKRDVMLFERHLEDNLFLLYEDLSRRTYQHQPYHRFTVCDPKPRVIHKACVRDRVMHHVLFRYLERLYQPSFFFHSYSCQNGKGTHGAVRALDRALRKATKNYTNYVWALKMDVKKFFDSVDQVILMKLLQRRVHDQDMLHLIQEIVYGYQSFQGPGKGIPIGNLTSQIFANIYLSELDYFVKHTLKAHYYFRYADDSVILHEDPGYLTKVCAQIQDFLGNTLQLSLHPRKVTIRKSLQGIDFLGYVLLPHYRVLRTTTKQRMFAKMQSQVQALNEGQIDAQSFHQSMQSYLGMLQHCKGYRMSQALQNMVWVEREA